MIKHLLLTFLFFSSLIANQVIYIQYSEIPKRVVKGEIFPITLKYLSTIKEFEGIEYNFTNYSGLEILTDIPEKVQKGKYFYDTFYLLTTSSSAKLPDVEVSLQASQEYNSTKINGEKLNIITLNPKKDFSGIIANKFELVEYKTTSFDNKYNIIVLVASAENCNIKSMHFNNVYKQGIESITESHMDSRITYYVIIDKKIENFSFSFFNLSDNKFESLNIPILVDDDSVATQSDLTPKDQSREQLKITIAGIIAILALVFIILRRKFIYLVFIAIPLIYIGYLVIPDNTVCVKKDSNIFLLPVSNGTIFETTAAQYTLPKEGSTNNFVKIKLINEKIGWVRNEDICSY